MKKILIFTNGCGRRKLDSENLRKFFKLNGYICTKSMRKADCIVFLTCGFTQKREEESLKIIKRLKKTNGKLIVAGCLPEIAKKKISKIHDGEVLSTRNIEEIDKIFPHFRYYYADIQDSNEINSSIQSVLSILSTKSFKNKLKWNSVRLLKEGFFSFLKNNFYKKRKVYYLRISRGCLGNCSYCSIKNAIGDLKSKPIEVCVREYQKAIDNNYKKIVILADDVGAYGLDIGSSFPKLLDQFKKNTNSKKIKWSIKELHPRWVVKYRKNILNKIKEGRIKHILCGVQSGSNRILKLMNRHHDREEIIDALKDFRKVNSKIMLSTQVIVGFPSESKEDFLQTKDLLKKVRFDKVIIYPYSERAGTLSVDMEGKVSDFKKKERVNSLLNFLEKEQIEAYTDNL